MKKRTYIKTIAMVIAMIMVLPTIITSLSTSKVYAQEEFKFGAEALISEEKDIIKGKRVGLVTNPTGVDQNLRSIVDILYNDPDINLTALYGPEHGVRGNEQAGGYIESYTDPETGLPVYSLYGKTRKPSAEMLKDVDAILFDIQDAGVTYYTYIWSMFYVLQAAAENDKEVIILDRPNPLGGDRVEGPVTIEEGQSTFVGLKDLALRHGMTFGELAHYLNEEFNVGADVKVVKMRNYDRSKRYDELNIPFVLPSPNLPTTDSVNVYPITGFFETFSNISEGRGTTKPFQLVGAEFVNSTEYARVLNELNLPGVRFRAAAFTPAPNQKLAGKLVQGVEVYVTDSDSYDPIYTGLSMIKTLHDLYGDKIQWRKDGWLAKLTGKTYIEEDIKNGVEVKDIIAKWENELNEFKEIRKKYLLYGEEAQKRADIGVEIRGLDNKRTTDVTVKLFDSNDKEIEGAFNESGQWKADRLSGGKYKVVISELPDNTKVVLNDTVSTQIGVAGENNNEFTFEITGEETSRQYIALRIVEDKVEETEDEGPIVDETENETEDECEHQVIDDSVRDNSKFPHPEYIDLLDDIIKSENNFGLSGAQLAVYKDGNLIKNDGYGYINNYKNLYDEKGNVIFDKYEVLPKEERTPVTTDTLFDLASNTKMYSTVFALQKLVSEGKVSLDTKISEIFPEFLEYTNDNKWKDNIDLRMVLSHVAGFAPDPQYHNEKFDRVDQIPNGKNDLYSQEKSTTFDMIMRTPLQTKPDTDWAYSDADFMLAGFIVEKLTGVPLDQYVKENIYEPLGLNRITYNPLQNGFIKDELSSSELNGNTRGGRIKFNNVRTEIVSGEVHDEKAYYSMGGSSGHAGLFGSAQQIAYLAQAMIYDGNLNGVELFNKETIDQFTEKSDNLATQAKGGWRRKSEQGGAAVWYSKFAPAGTIGHTGWTGTNTMIDKENKITLSLNTNARNTPMMGDADSFYTKNSNVSSYGLVSELVYRGLGLADDVSVDEVLINIINAEIEGDYNGASPSKRNVIRSLIKVLEKRSVNNEVLLEFLNSDKIQNIKKDLRNTESEDLEKVALLCNTPEQPEDPKDPEEPEQPEEPKLHEIKGFITGTTNVRISPNGPIIGTLEREDIVEGEYEKGSNWIKFDYHGQEAYVYKPLLSDTVEVRGFASGDSNIRKTPNGQITAVAKREEVVKGVVSIDKPNWVKTDKGYIYRPLVVDSIKVRGLMLGTTNVRMTPNGTLIGTLGKAEYVEGTLNITNPNWVRVKYQNRDRYVYRSLIVDSVSVSGTVTATVNVRQTPNGKVLGTHRKGVKLTGKVSVSNPNWVEIQYKGQRAYVYKDFVK